MNEDNVLMERNFAREVGLFNPPKETSVGEIAESAYTTNYNTEDGKINITYFRDGQRVVYIPAECAQMLSNLPAARLALAALITLWLRDREKGAPPGEPIRTTLGELCRVVGMTPNGPRRIRMKQALLTLHYVRFRNLMYFDHEVSDRRGKKTRVQGRRVTFSILAPEVRFFDSIVDGERQDTTVEVHLSPSLVRSLALDVPKAKVPVAALRATYGNTQATKAMQNVLFWLSAVTPERPGTPLRPKSDTLIDEVMRPEGRRRDKNIQKLKKILNFLEKSGVIAWWKFDGDHCVIMKKRDQEIAENKKKKALPENTKKTD